MNKERSIIWLMKLRDVIKNLQERCAHGEFRLRRGESINEAVLRNDVPNKPGVYLIFDTGDLECPIYIGKAGTMNQDGSWKAQGIKGRLRAKQKKKRRVRFFIEKMDEDCHKA
jgi:hypothetical protein